MHAACGLSRHHAALSHASWETSGSVPPLFSAPTHAAWGTSGSAPLPSMSKSKSSTEVGRPLPALPGAPMPASLSHTSSNALRALAPSWYGLTESTPRMSTPCASSARRASRPR
eukprot:78608-Chlamydomonas_euryale.AAC.3